MDDAARTWITHHPFLEGVAGFHDAVGTAIAAASLPRVTVPALEVWDEDLVRGVPLLRSERVGLAGAPELGEAVARLAASVAAAPIPQTFRSAAADLYDFLRGPEGRPRVVGWLLRGGDAELPGEAGVTRFVGWHALAHALAPVVEACATRRDDDRWNRGSCPTCGAQPGMAQLVPAAGVRRRMLACGQCRTRWKHRRTACPHCGNEDERQLAVLEVEGGSGLRLDVCEACKGYVKTSDASAGDLLLADWPTLHLDVVAAERGYQRRGASLYELEG